MKETNALFHSFTTGGYAAWGELFLESLRAVYGSNLNVWIDGLNLSEHQITVLENTYKDVRVVNEIENDKTVEEVIGTNAEDIHRWMNEIEMGITTGENFKYKLYMSVNKRYRNLGSVIKDAGDMGYKYFVHTDIDLYFRHEINGVFDILDNHDAAFYFRPAADHTYAVLGAFLAFRLNANTIRFVDEWMAQIDKVPFKERWRGFGQSVLFFTYEKVGSGVSVADLSSIEQAPKISKKFEPNAHIWMNSNSLTFGNIKLSSRKKSWNDLKRKYPKLEPFSRPRIPYKAIKTRLLKLFRELTR
ncbi:MAG: hypothetical protein WD356_09210 [Pseudomonadales bacterium]